MRRLITMLTVVALMVAVLATSALPAMAYQYCYDEYLGTDKSTYNCETRTISEY